MHFKDKMFLSLSTTSFLIMATVNITKGQFKMEASHSKCGTRDCVIISSCPAVLKLVFQVKSGDQSAKNKLLRSQCGFERNLPKVCCERKKPKVTLNSQPIERSTTSAVIKSSITTTTTISTLTSTTTTSTTTTTTTTTTTSTTSTTTISTTSTTTTTTATTVPTTKTQSTPSPDSNFPRINAKSCGTRTSLQFRITFGKLAGEGQFPWVVSLIYKNRRAVSIPLCGGALVSSQHVVTAAHCDASQGGFSLRSVILGQTDISGPVQLPGLEVDIGKVVRHPKYTTNPVAEMDIAIIKLVKPVTFTDMIRPICLFSPNIKEVEDPVNGLIVAGWGRTERARSSDTLQFTFLNFIPMKECQAVYSAAEKEGRLGQISDFTILESQMCAQGEGKTDSCSGDSGGPLMSQVGSTWYLAGVVSFGTQQCDSSLPGVYTRISHFLPWIQNTLETI